jgi:hypothetical protein
MHLDLLGLVTAAGRRSPVRIKIQEERMVGVGASFGKEEQAQKTAIFGIESLANRWSM